MYLTYVYVAECLHSAAVCWRRSAPSWGLGEGDDGGCQGV